MRLEATIPDSRGFALQELADQLGLSRSQLQELVDAPAKAQRATEQSKAAKRTVDECMRDSEGRGVGEWMEAHLNHCQSAERVASDR